MQVINIHICFMVTMISGEKKR